MGAVVSIFGTIIPPFAIISIISVGYNAFRDNYIVSQLLEGMQAGVGAVIASVTFEMGGQIGKEKDTVSILIMAGAFLASCILKVNVIYIVITCGILGVIRTFLGKGRECR